MIYDDLPTLMGGYVFWTNFFYQVAGELRVYQVCDVTVLGWFITAYGFSLLTELEAISIILIIYILKSKRPS